MFSDTFKSLVSANEIFVICILTSEYHTILTKVALDTVVVLRSNIVLRFARIREMV